MYTPEDSPFEKFRTEKLKGVAMSPDVLELVAKAYECGFIDGMQKQMQSSVDRAVNRMAEQAEQAQPVAWMDDEMNCIFFDAERPEPFDFDFWKPLYTSPPHRQPWVGLDDTDLDVCDTDGRLLARYWERVLKEKNT